MRAKAMSSLPKMQKSEFDFVNGLFLRIAEKKKKNGYDSLTAEERVVFLVWDASGIIENGGLQYFYEQEFDAEAVAAAYEKIGCQKCAELLKLSFSLFPPSVLQGSWSDRVAFVERNSEMFDNLSNAFWEADEEMEKRLADYIKHREVNW